MVRAAVRYGGAGEEESERDTPMVDGRLRRDPKTTVGSRKVPEGSLG